MKKALTFLTVGVALVAFASPAGAAIHFDSVSRDGGEIPKKATTWQILPLKTGDSYIVCVFASNNQGKKCKTSFRLNAYLAEADAPIEPVSSFGGFGGNLRVKGSPSASDFLCAVSPGAPSGVDYMILEILWKSKSCRRIKSDRNGDAGVFSGLVEPDASPARTDRPLAVWRTPGN